MGVIKKIGNKSYSQDSKGDWYEVENPVQKEPVNAKVVNGVSYYKDANGDWYEGETVKKKWWRTIGFRSPIYFKK